VQPEVIDKKEFDVLVETGLSPPLIADYFAVTEGQLNDWVRENCEIKPAAYFRMRAAKVKAGLLQRQMALASQGNATMLIWLGKNMLGQVEKAESDADSGERVVIVGDVAKAMAKAMDAAVNAGNGAALE
jgi:hypothetical protein